MRKKSKTRIALINRLHLELQGDRRREKEIGRKLDAALKQAGQWKEYVYFLYCEQIGRIKIGKSKDSQRRIDGQAFLPVAPTWVKSIWKPDFTESSVHKRFAHLRVYGEWFNAAPELLDFIDQLCHEVVL